MKSSIYFDNVAKILKRELRKKIVHRLAFTVGITVVSIPGFQQETD